MKNLIVGSLIALAASQAAGCIITSGDDSEDAFITANWQIHSISSNQNVTCPPGFDTAALYNQPINSNGDKVGQPVIDLFDCAAHSGVSAPLAPGLYQSWIEIANHDNTDVYAKSLSAPVDVIDEDKSFTVQILDDGGYFQLSWSLVDAASNAPLTCAQAASTGVEAIGSIVSDPNSAASDVFDCEDGYGVSAGYGAADYTVSIHALGAGDTQLGDSQVVNRATIKMKNQVTDLGDFMLPID